MYDESMYNTQNQPSQSGMYTMFDYSMNTYANLADSLTFLIKQGRLTCFAFFDFDFFRLNIVYIPD